MNAFWQNLSSRERIFVAVGGVIVSLCLMFLVVVGPLLSWRDDMQQKAQTSERNYDLVRQAASRRPAVNSAQDIDANTPVRIVLTQTEVSRGFQISSYQELPNGQVTASADHVSAEQLFAWFGDMERRYGIFVITADIAREADNPDLVRVQLTLGRKG